LFSLGIVLLLGTLGATVLTLSLNEGEVGRRSAGWQRAFFLAEAGLDQALLSLRASPGWTGAAYTLLDTVDADKGGYAVDVDPPYEAGDSTLADATLRRVTASGYYPSNAAGNPPRQIEAIVQLAGSNFDYGLFANGDISLKSNAAIDSFDSRLGFYGGANRSSDGDVGSNAINAGTITLESNAKIKGDAIIGPGGNVSTGIVLGSQAQITGIKGTLTQTKTLTTPDFSGTCTTPLELDSNESLTLPGGTYQYTHVELKSNSSVLVSGSVTLYVNEQFKMDSNATFLTTCADCTIVIYVKGDPAHAGPAVELKSNSYLAAGSIPTRLKLVVGDDALTGAGSVELKSNAVVHGAVYAPLSDIKLDSNAKLYGAAIGRTIEIKSNAVVHYDRALQDGEGGGGGTQPRLKSWREL